MVTPVMTSVDNAPTMTATAASSPNQSSSSSSVPSSLPPKQSIVHSSLVSVQCMFGAGGVIAALGLPACNPFAFALYREVTAGIILIVAATIATASASSQSQHFSAKEGKNIIISAEDEKESKEPLLVGLTNPSPPSFGTLPNSLIASIMNRRKPLLYQKVRYAWLPWHFPNATIGSILRLLVLGLMIFGNQIFVIMGIKLAGPVSCAVWQPSQPIFTAAISMLLGREPFRLFRVMGVFLAFAGCVVMVMVSQEQQQQPQLSHSEEMEHGAAVAKIGALASKLSDNNNQPTNHTNNGIRVLGNSFFFINCLCVSLYVILSKPSMKVYPALFVTAWSYNVAAFIMAIAALIAAHSPSVMHLVCPDCVSYWVIPPGAYFALSYYIFFCSVLAYGMLTWANQFVTGTLVMGYTVLQPVTATALTVFLLYLQIFSSCSSGKHDASSSSTTHPKPCLEQPSMGTLIGMMGVFVGLFFVVSTEPSSSSSAAKINNVATPPMVSSSSHHRAANYGRSNSSDSIRLRKDEQQLLLMEEDEGAAVALSSIHKINLNKRAVALQQDSNASIEAVKVV